MNDLVTIIIPVYNVEKYLDKAVQSAVNQTYKNIEIYLVDDGSKDDSGKKCDLWMTKDDRIRVIHKENGGLSSARNAALDVCVGDYIYFMDSDDYIDEKAIELMLEVVYKTGARMIEAPFIHVYENKTSVRAALEDVKIMNTVEAIKFDLGAGGGAVSSCSKLFVKDIFSNYRFAEGKLNEDHFSIVDLLSMAQDIAVEPKPLYYYYHRQNSITTKSFSRKSLDDLEAAQKNYELIKSQFPEAMNVAEFRLDFSTLKIIDKIMLSEPIVEKELLNALINDVKKHKRRILRSSYFTKKRKISFVLLIISKSLYCWFVRDNAKKSIAV